MTGKYSSEVVSITPDLAGRWLTDHAYEMQRSARPSHVAYLANEAVKGRLECDLVVLCHVGNSAFLTDGQHRLNAIAESGTSVEQVVLHRFCVDMAEVNRDYAHRGRGMIRTPADAYRANGLAADLGFTATQLNVMAGCLWSMLDGFRRAPRQHLLRSTDVRSQFIQDWAVEGSAYFNCIAGADRATSILFHRASVMAVGLVTLRHQEAVATEFWETIAKDDGLRDHTPEKTLLKWLRNYPANAFTPDVYARYVAAAWNAKYSGEECRLLRASGPSSPILIKGTPYDGKTVQALPYE